MFFTDENLPFAVFFWYKGDFYSGKYQVYRRWRQRCNDLCEQNQKLQDAHCNEADSVYEITMYQQESVLIHTLTKI